MVGCLLAKSLANPPSASSSSSPSLSSSIPSLSSSMSPGGVEIETAAANTTGSNSTSRYNPSACAASDSVAAAEGGDM